MPVTHTELRLASLFVALLAVSASAQTELALGPSAVGVRELLLRDPSRPTLPLTEAGTARDARGRQMHIVVWYPSVRGTGRVMTRGDYVHMAARTLDHTPLTPDRRVAAVAAFTARARALGGDSAALERALPALLSASVGARLDARPLAGRHPLILFPEWQPPSVNNVMAEHLASYGYVVASVATKGSHDAQIEYWSPRGFETMVADLRFVLQALDTVPFVDTRRIGAMGVGISASAGLGLAMRTPSVAAIACVEGGLTTEGEMGRLMRTPYFDVGAVRAPILAITAPHPAVDAARLDLYRYATRHLVHFQRMSEFWFLDYGLLSTQSPGIIGRQPADVALGFTHACDIVLRFFDTYIREDSTARRWLDNLAPSSVGAPTDLFVSSIRRSLPPPPTVSQLKAMLQRAGVAEVSALIASHVARDSQPIPSEYFVELNGALGAGGDPSGSMRFELSKLRAAIYPQSARANYSLGSAALSRQDTVLARTHLSAALRAVAADRDPLLDQTTRQRIERQATSLLQAIGGARAP